MTAEAASNASVADILAQFDGDFADMAKAFGNGSFALWVGSGISFERAPSLGDLISRAIEFLRQKAVDPATEELFEPAFRRALAESQAPTAAAEPYFTTPLAEWPDVIRSPIIGGLWNRYSHLLNIRIADTPEDYILWEAIDIRDAFADPNPPGCAHLSIAVLVLEGVLQQIASANWDGFIEAAVEQLAGSLASNLHVVVDPTHLRDVPGKARLIKFHGCILHATEDEAAYRRFLVGSSTQITAWMTAQFFAAIRAEVVSLATNYRALMAGLSLQDGNLQFAFGAARQANPWPWPCEPQGHVFCEGEIGPGQQQMLQTVYSGSYNNAIAEIESSALLVAWGEQVLLALVFKIITDKFAELVGAALAGHPLATEADAVIISLTRLRDVIAAKATGDRTTFFADAITQWSRILGLFRTGRLPHNPERYEVLTGGPVGGVAHDQNARAAGLGELGVGFALLQRGYDQGLWTIGPPEDVGVAAGAVSALASWDGATTRPIFFARSAQMVIALQKSGAFANDNAVVIHADNAWHEMQDASVVDSPRSISRSPGRNGTIGTQHVSLAKMISEEATVDEMTARFVREVSL